MSWLLLGWAGCSQVAVTQPPGASWAESFSKWVIFLGTVIDLAQMRIWITPERSMTIYRLLESFRFGTSCLLRVFQRMLCLMSAASSVIPLGLLHMRSLQFWPKTQVPSHAWCLTSSPQGDPPLHQSCGSLEGPSPASDGRPIGTDPQKESGHNWYVQPTMDCCPGTILSGELRLHPQVVQMIWSVYRRAEVDLIAFTAQHVSWGSEKLWPTNGPEFLVYAFPLIVLLPQVIRQVREVRCSVLLVFSLCRNQTCFPELIQLLSTSPWPIPLRNNNLLSQTRGLIWHPLPELWSLHIWCLDGSLYSSPWGWLITFWRLQPHLQEASTPLNHQSFLTGVQHLARTHPLVTCHVC